MAFFLSKLKQSNHLNKAITFNECNSAQKCYEILENFEDFTLTHLFDIVFLTEFNLVDGYNFIAFSSSTKFKKGTFIVLTSHLVNQNYKIAVEPAELYSDFNFNFYEFNYKQFQNQNSRYIQHVGEPITSYKRFSLSMLSSLKKYRFIFNVILKNAVVFKKLEISFKKKYSNSGSYFLSIAKNNLAPEFKKLIQISGILFILNCLFVIK